MPSNKQKRIVLTISKQIYIIKRIEEGETITHLANVFGVGKSTKGDIKPEVEKIKSFANAFDSGS